MIKSIGGEFEIDPNLLKERKSTIWTNEYLVASGRDALFSILYVLRAKFEIKAILLPDYLCKSIIDTALKLNYKLDFYKLNENLTIDREKFILKTNKLVILIINYFGLIDVNEEIDWLKNKYPNIFIILDNVQAFFEMNKITDADFVFTSFRKTLPVPDGGWVKSKYNLDPFWELKKSKNKFSVYKLLGAILKYYSHQVEMPDDFYLNLFYEGEKLIDSYSLPRDISYYTLSIMNNIDLNKIKNGRCRNASLFQQKIENCGIKQLIKYNEGHVPLFLPIMLSNKDLIKKKLEDKRIYLPSHWPVEKEFSEFLYMGSLVYQSELSLVIDQRYSTKDIEDYFDILIEIINEYNN
jgi:hypothetical protein